MDTDVRSRTIGYDRFKGAVAIGLLIVIIILLLRGCGASPVEKSPVAELPAAEPALPTLYAPRLGEGGSLTLSGRGEPGATIELWAGDTRLGEALVDSDGDWSWDGTLDPGDYAIVARTLDASGQALNETPAYAFTVPAVPIIPVVHGPQVDPQGGVTLGGTGEPGTTLEILEDGAVVGSAVVQEDGTWTLTYESSAGAHQVTARSQAEPDTVSAAVEIEVPAAAPEGEGAGTPDQPAQGEAYIVQRGDWLSALAKRFYGDPQPWRLIFEGTNARAAEDASFHEIADPDLIEPGWKLWIPAQTAP